MIEIIAENVEHLPKAIQTAVARVEDAKNNVEIANRKLTAAISFMKGCSHDEVEHLEQNCKQAACDYRYESVELFRLLVQHNDVIEPILQRYVDDTH